MAVGSILTILSIGAVINGDRTTLGEIQYISYLLAILYYWQYGSNIIVILKCCNYCLQTLYIGINLVYKGPKLFKGIPCGDFYLRSIKQSKHHEITI